MSLQRELEVESEKVALEVDAEMLFLNAAGLHALGVTLGIRENRLERQNRFDLLTAVRASLLRAVDGNESVAGKTAFLKEVRDNIRRLMLEPNNWEQTLERRGGMAESTNSPSAVSRDEVSDYVPQQQPRVRPIPRPRPSITPAPVTVDDLRSEVTATTQRNESVDLDPPTVEGSAENHPVPSARVSVASEEARQRVRPMVLPPFSPLSLNSVPPWNRLHSSALDRSSLNVSLRRRVADDRQRQLARESGESSVSLTDTFGQLSESGEDDRSQDHGDAGDQGATYSVVNASDEEDVLKLTALQKEIDALKLKRKRRVLSSKSSSSGSSVQTVPHPKVPRSDLDDCLGHRRKVGVTGPVRPSDHHSSDDSSSDGSGKKSGKPRKRKSSDGNSSVDISSSKGKSERKAAASAVVRSSKSSRKASGKKSCDKSPVVVASDPDHDGKKSSKHRHVRSGRNDFTVPVVPAVDGKDSKRRRSDRSCNVPAVPDNDGSKTKSRLVSRVKSRVVSPTGAKVKRHSRKSVTPMSCTSSPDGSDSSSSPCDKPKKSAVLTSKVLSSAVSKSARCSKKKTSSSRDDKTKRRRHSRKRSDRSSSESSGSSSDDSSGSSSDGSGSSPADGRTPRKSKKKSKRKSSKGCTVADLKDAWRREFKIKGQIGKVGDKENKLDYISVKRQITKGKARGHKDPEIVEGVIYATVPGSTLRKFLQSSDDLSVPTLLDILRAYFREADTVDLLQQLATASQGPKEDAQTFLMACLDLKNRIIRNEDNGVGFSRETVMKILLKTLESGLSSDRILNSVRSHLSNTNVEDSVLIALIGHAVTMEEKRKEKGKSHRVNMVEESSDDAEIIKLQQQLAALQQQQLSDSARTAQLEQIQASINKLMAGKQQRQYGCAACKKAGQGKTCSHCFVCGKDDHRVVDCPERVKKSEKADKDDSLNSNRSPARDI